MTALAPSATRPAPDEHAPYYANYIGMVPEGDVLDLMTRQVKETTKLLAGIPDAKAGYRYAPGKWSIKGLVGHVVDSERVFSYRALSIGRGDPSPLPGFDEKAWAQVSNADERPLKELIKDYEAARQATLALFRSLPADGWARRGTANNYPVTVRALAWIILGHERHHLKILRERYLGAPHA